MGMKSLKKLNLRHNLLSGTLPADWIGPGDVWPSVQYIDLRYNDLVGSFPVVAPGPNFRIQSRRGGDRNPNLFLEPMNYGFGMCGPTPQAGPLISSPVGDALRFGEQVAPLQRFLLDCPPSSAPPLPSPLPFPEPLNPPKPLPSAFP
jgi:hypothetical protein